MSHHVSDIGVWGGPDRSYFVFVALSIVFGFVGLDHFYLRSFGTGVQKCIMNILTLGLWNWWDLIQIMTEGSKIRNEGLSSPFDWIQGIGRGTFVPLPADRQQQQQQQQQAQGQQQSQGQQQQAQGQHGGGGAGEGVAYSSEKSYLLYTFLAVCFGWLGADKFYLGEIWQGFAKLISCFNIFLFLFGWMWVAWDAFHAFFMTSSVMKSGISAPLPYSFLFNEPIKPDAFLVKETTAASTSSAQSMNLLDWLAKILHFPGVPSIPFRELYTTIFGPLLTVPVVRAVQSIREITPTIPTVTMPTVDIASMPSAMMPAVDMAKVKATAAAATALPQTKEALHVMAGGGMRDHGAAAGAGAGAGPGPVLAGALTAIVLAGGLKGFYDFISKQYG